MPVPTLDPNLQVTALDVPTAILQRRSIKNFKADPIPSDLLKQLVELTIAAPSSWNLQDWRIVIVQSDEKKQALSDAAWGQQQIVQAPVTFVFAADATAWQTDLPMIFEEALQQGAWTEQTVEYFKSAIPGFQENLGNKNREYAIKDAMIAATHLALAAESFGLSSCFMNGWLEDKVKEVIGVADQPELAIAVLLPIGYSAEPRSNPGRLPLNHNVFVDTFGNPYQ
ncbi:MAG: nitroreductase family protein [Elainellaceae cyanobacterium]